MALPHGLIRRAPQIAKRVNSGCLHGGQRFLSHSEELLDGQRIENRMQIVGPEPAQSVGFVEIRSDFRQKLVRTDANRRGKARTCAYSSSYLHRDGLAIAEQPRAPGHIQKGLVEGKALHQGCDIVENLEHLFGDLLVARHSRLYANGRGAKAQRLAHRHRGAHAESPHGVTRGGDDAAPAGAADDEWFALQLRPIPLLHRRIERIHVDVQNGAGVAMPCVATPHRTGALHGVNPR
jgi:hypothetical protein